MSTGIRVSPVGRFCAVAGCGSAGTHLTGRRRRGREAALCAVHWQVLLELRKGRLRRGWGRGPVADPPAVLVSAPASARGARCSRCGRSASIVYTAPDGDRQRAFCPGCFLTTGDIPAGAICSRVGRERMPEPAAPTYLDGAAS